MVTVLVSLNHIPVKITLDIFRSSLKVNGAPGNIQGNFTTLESAGDHFFMKMLSYYCSNFHYKDKKVSQPSYQWVRVVLQWVQWVCLIDEKSASLRLNWGEFKISFWKYFPCWGQIYFEVCHILKLYLVTEECLPESPCWLWWWRDFQFCFKSGECQCVPCNDINSLTHWPLGDFAVILKAYIVFNLSLHNTLDTHCEIPLRWMPWNLANEKSTLVPVRTWRCQATSHCVNQCWPRSMSPYHVTRPQWVTAWTEWWNFNQNIKVSCNKKCFSKCFICKIVSILLKPQ